MGQNLEEANANPDWRCPVCLDLCNCSGVNCLRAKRDLAPTQQLTAEAKSLGYKSVAHYLIQTELREGKALAVAQIEEEAGCARRRCA